MAASMVSRLESCDANRP